jgi:hypothetical protein
MARLDQAATTHGGRIETMRPIFEYLDYRDLLKDALEDRKAANPAYSFRMMGEALGLHTSNVFRILNKETHLPARCQSRAVEYLGLTERSASYFLLLVGYARERSGKARQEMLEKAMALARREPGGPGREGARVLPGLVGGRGARCAGDGPRQGESRRRSRAGCSPG